MERRDKALDDLDIFKMRIENFIYNKLNLLLIEYDDYPSYFRKGYEIAMEQVLKQLENFEESLKEMNEYEEQLNVAKKK